MIYYYESPDSSEAKPTLEDWELWSYFIPKPGTKGIDGEGAFLDYNSDTYEAVDGLKMGETIVPFNLELNDSMKHFFIQGVWKAYGAK